MSTARTPLTDACQKLAELATTENVTAGQVASATYQGLDYASKLLNATDGTLTVEQAKRKALEGNVAELEARIQALEPPA